MSEPGGTLARIAADVRAGRRSAVAIARQTIADIRARDGAIGAVTRLLEARALADAARVDDEVAAGRDPGPLAGVPFGVKDLFDVAGLPNTAGSRLRQSAPPATCDAEAVRRLRDAGAVLVATLNMDEFAYGFATVNAFHGTTRNPHDPTRLAGGSSGGSAAAVASGMLPLALGSDTNGSIRIPAALCGVYGLKPTHGALPLSGVAPFVDSFDDSGPFAASLPDLELAVRVLSDGKMGSGPAPIARIGRLGGWFARNLAPDMAGAIAEVAHRLDARDVELPEVAVARSAAYVMTAMEGGALHLPDLRRRALEFDPATRDRLLAGALMPGSAYFEAQRFRAWFAKQAAALFERFDVLIAPATGMVAPPTDAPTIEIDGQQVPARAHLGLYTQPLSFIGLPALAVPLRRPGLLPLGLQLVGAPGREASLFALAEQLEADGLTGVSPPQNRPT
jgi:aspartyl-tRNA(Asn)/glutamyl-tRNA(Gln) amidotransferase subunit A